MEGIASVPINSISQPGGLFLSALFVHALPLTAREIGFITTLFFTGNTLQVAVMFLLAQRFAARRITVIAALLHLGTWIALGCFPFCTENVRGDGVFVFVAVWALMSGLFNAITAASWTAWMEERVPASLRGEYFGFRNGKVQLANVAFLLFCGWYLSLHDYAIHAFQQTLLLGAGLRSLCLYWQWIAPDWRSRRQPPLDGGWVSRLRAVFQAREFRRFVWFAGFVTFVTSGFSVFYNVFLLEVIGISAWTVSVLASLSLGVGALSLPLWGRCLDRMGHVRMLRRLLVLSQLASLLWCWVTPGGQSMLYLLMICTGITGAGYALAQFSCMLRLVPAKNRDMGIAAYMSFCSVSSLFAPVLAGIALRCLNSLDLNEITCFKLGFALQALLGGLGILFLGQSRRPECN